MTKFIKRLSCIFVCTCLAVSIVPIVAKGEENEFVAITVGQGATNKAETEFHYCKVVRCENDYLFSGEELAHLTGYEYEVKDQKAFFFRGNKQVVIDIKKNTIQVFDDLSIIKLRYPVVAEDNEFYFSGVQVLPWLNVSCYEENGILYVIPDMVSLWDFQYKYDQEKESFVFDFENCCEQLGIESKWLQVANYVRSNGIGGMVKDVTWIPFSSYTYGEYKDYYDIFEKMFKETNSIIATYESFVDNGKKINSAFSFIEAIDSNADIPEEFEIFRAGGKVLSGADEALKFTIYLHSFNQNNEEKLMWMKMLTGNRDNFKYPEAMVAAAFDIEATYLDVLDGVALKVVQKITDGAIEGLINEVTGEGIVKTALEGMGIWEEFSPDWVSGIDNIGYYNTIAECGMNVYEAYGEGSAVYDLQMRRAHAVLYLYATEQNWRTMADYAQDKELYAIADEYNDIADKLLEWQGKFIASGGATVNDSFEYEGGRVKERYTEELQKLFYNLSVTKDGYDENIVEEDNSLGLVGVTEENIASILQEYIFYEPGIQDLLLQQFVFGENGKGLLYTVTQDGMQSDCQNFYYYIDGTTIAICVNEVTSYYLYNESWGIWEGSAFVWQPDGDANVTTVLIAYNGAINANSINKLYDLYYSLCDEVFVNENAAISGELISTDISEKGELNDFEKSLTGYMEAMCSLDFRTCLNYLPEQIREEKLQEFETKHCDLEEYSLNLQNSISYFIGENFTSDYYMEKAVELSDKEKYVIEKTLEMFYGFDCKVETAYQVAGEIYYRNGAQISNDVDMIWICVDNLWYLYEGFGELE